MSFFATSVKSKNIDFAMLSLFLSTCWQHVLYHVLCQPVNPCCNIWHVQLRYKTLVEKIKLPQCHQAMLLNNKNKNGAKASNPPNTPIARRGEKCHINFPISPLLKIWLQLLPMIRLSIQLQPTHSTKTPMKTKKNKFRRLVGRQKIDNVGIVWVRQTLRSDHDCTTWHTSPPA